MWDTSSIEAMERTAKGEADGCCSLNIRGHWLEVRWDGKSFEYRWGKNTVTRKDAIEVRKTK